MKNTAKLEVKKDVLTQVLNTNDGACYFEEEELNEAVDEAIDELVAEGVVDVSEGEDELLVSIKDETKAAAYFQDGN